MNKQQIKDNRCLRQETISNIEKYINKEFFTFSNFIYVQNQTALLTELSQDWEIHHYQLSKKEVFRGRE